MMLGLSIIPWRFKPVWGGLKSPKIFGCNYYAMKSLLVNCVGFTLNDIYTSKAKTFSSK